MKAVTDSMRRTSRAVWAAAVIVVILVFVVATRSASPTLRAACRFSDLPRAAGSAALPFFGTSTLRPCACGVATDIELVSFVVDYFRGACGGTFIDIGANDGVTISNSLALEESLGWSGVCVEPHPGAFTKLTKNRPRCTRVNAGIGAAGGTFDFLAVTGYAEMLSGWLAGATPDHLARVEKEIAAHGGTKAVIPVKSLSFGTLLSNRAAVVDFVSIDVEGHELEVLRGIDFSRVLVKLFVIEFNSDELRTRLEAFMGKAGFEVVGGKPINGHNIAFAPTHRAVAEFAARAWDSPSD